MLRPAYDVSQSYEWNYQNGPVVEGPFPEPRTGPPRWPFLGFMLHSPLGVAAGLLLNSRWIEVYARLGFDLLTYKTLRTRRYLSHPPPNCLLVDTGGPLTPDRFRERLVADAYRPGSIREVTITNSFGVPSRDPKEWQEDVQRAARAVGEGQLLVVSVMGTWEEGSGVEPKASTPNDPDGFVRDFARAGSLAAEAGAPVIELDLSCPNSPVAEGEVFLNAEFSSRITRAVRAEIGDRPLIIKTGYYPDIKVMREVLRANAPYIQAVAGINTIRMEVVRPDGSDALPGRRHSGICGAAILERGLEFAKMALEIQHREGYDFSVIGVGGVMTPEDADRYLDLGVDAIETCTGAMWDPLLAAKFHSR